MNALTKAPGTPARDDELEAYVLRHPDGCDAIAIRQIVAETAVLDVNSTYAYLLLATDFADTSIVAEAGGQVQGFVMGYQPPRRPDVLFVWQVAVAEPARGTGLAGAMLDYLVHRIRSGRHGHPLTVEATVAPDNAPSRALFGAFARRHGVPISEHPHFTADQLDPERRHADEPLLRIGPLTAALPA